MSDQKPTHTDRDGARAPGVTLLPHGNDEAGRAAPTRITLRETLGVIACLLGLIAVSYWPAVTGRGVFTPADRIFDYTFFHEARPAGYTGAANPAQSDPVQKFFPWYVVTREAIARGELPLWNPYIYTGTPLLANAESAVLYPVNVVSLLVPLPAALMLSALLRLLIAGVGMYALARELGGGRVAAGVSTLVFTFGGSLTVWLNYPVANTFVWLPALFYVTERQLRTVRTRYVAALALITAVQLTGGHVQTSFIMLVAWAGHVTYRLIGKCCAAHPDVVAVTTRLAAGIILGFLLAGVELAAFQEWLSQTSERELRLAERPTAIIDWSAWKGIVNAAVGFVLPNAFGRPTWGTALSFFHSNYIEEAVYVGVLPLVLALAAMTWWSGARVGELTGEGANNEPKWFVDAPYWTLMATVSLALAVRFPGLDLLNRLPVFDIVMPGRFRLITTFALAVLAGIGFERLVAPNRPGRELRRVILVLVGIGVGVVAAVAIVAVGVRVFEPAVRSIGRLDSAYPILRAAYRLTNLQLIWPAIIALVGAAMLSAWRAGRITARVTGATVLALVVIDLMCFGYGFNPVVPRERVFPDTPSTRFLRERLGSSNQYRVTALHDDMTPAIATPYRFSDISGTDFPQKRYLEFAKAGGGVLVDHFRIAFPTIDPRWLDLLSVRYLISSLPLEPRLQALVPVRKSNAYIYENPTALPRARLVRRIVIERDSSKILDRLKAETFDPGDTVVLETTPGRPLSGGSPSTGDLVTIRYAGGSRLVVDVTAETDALLVLADAYYPGWSATVDGRATEILRANYAFRAIEVPAGRHEVAFVYRPSHWRTGLLLSLTGLLGALACLLIPRSH